MAERTQIGWTGRSWNPIRGQQIGRDVGHGNKWACKTISPGCDYCYASALAKRHGGLPYGPEGDPLVDQAQLYQKALLEPLSQKYLKNPEHIFLSSMTDVFGDWVPVEWLDQMFAVMAINASWAAASGLPPSIFQVLTKRPGEALGYFDKQPARRVVEIAQNMHVRVFGREMTTWPGWPLPNVWMGVSVELQRYLWRAETLKAIPAVVRFLSVEPLLGPVEGMRLSEPCPACLGLGWTLPVIGAEVCHACDGSRINEKRRIHWVIVGGESGGPADRSLLERCPNIHGAHPAISGESCLCKGSKLRPKLEALGWVRSLRDQTKAQKAAFFFKQWGGMVARSGGNQLEGRTWLEMPDGRGGIAIYDKGEHALEPA